MQKSLFSAPDGPGGPGTRETAEVATATEAVASAEPPVSTASTVTTVLTVTVATVPPVSTDSTAPALVWPPTDEELDDWHVIPLKGKEAEAAAKAGNGNGNGNAGASGTPRKPLPAWLANHRAAKSGALAGTSGASRADGSPGAPGLNLAVPRPVAPPQGTGGIRAVTASPLEDTARFSSDTTTAITSLRKTAVTGDAPAVPLAPTVQPSVPATRPVATFPAERRRPMPVPQPAPSIWNGNVRRAAVVVLAVLAAGQAAYIGVRLVLTPAAASTSVLTVDSAPDGAMVLVDGEVRGVTPFKVELTAGSHSLELRKDGRSRKIPLVLAGGVQASQYVELGSASPSGSSASSSAPPAAPRPAVPPAATPSPAAPVPSSDVPAADAAAVAPVVGRGWVVIQSGLNLSVLRNGEMLGSSDEGRLALPAGRQELELVNDAVGYRAVIAVQVPPGRPLTVPVELPQSLLNVSATPSARVSVDGRAVGNTPITQLALPVGQHEILFEHPEYGERRMTVLVKVGTTAQASVDFTR